MEKVWGERNEIVILYTENIQEEIKIPYLLYVQ